MIDLTKIARKAMIEKKLKPDYSKEALAQLAKLNTPLLYSPDPSIKDLRDLLWVSIDNDDSQDLDQLTYADKLDGEKAKIYIAIADVDALIKKGSAIDRDAQNNTTSVYTPTKIFSMLPEKLSTNLTSLNEHQDRLAMVVEIIVEKDGSLGSSTVYPAWVNNHAKLAYPSLGEWLEKKGPPPELVEKNPRLQSQIILQNEISKRMRAFRHGQGSLSLMTIEARAVVDKGIIVDLRAVIPNRAMKLIEDFMIAANESTTRFLMQKNFPTLRRVVKTPEKWDRIVTLAKELHYTLPEEPDSKALDGFLTFRKQEDPGTFPDLSLSVIKLLGRGEYEVNVPGQKPSGHFGLALKDYSHSTAPNRRYPDIVTQRLLKAAMGGKENPYSKNELMNLALHCTEKEDAAERVERKVKKSAAALLLASKLNQTFDAIVTGASERGTWVRIFQPPVEGKLIKGIEGLDVGDRIRVRLLKVDVTHGFIDFVRERQ